MTRPFSILQFVLGLSWVREPARRRAAAAVLILAFGLLSFWPRPYEARAALKPLPAGAGIAALLGQDGGLASLGDLLGGHQDIETDLAIARSDAVLIKAIGILPSDLRRDLGSDADAEVKVRRYVEIESLRGGLLQISARSHSKRLSLSLVEAFVSAVSEQLSAVNQREISSRKAVAQQRLDDAIQNLSESQQALASYQKSSGVAVPTLQVGATVTLLSGLEAKLEAEEVQLRSLDNVLSPNNVQRQVLEAEVANLRAAIARVQNGANTKQDGAPGLIALTKGSAEYTNLYTKSVFAQAMYVAYLRAVEQITLQDLSSGNSINITDPAHIRPDRQYNLIAVLLLLVVSIGFFYVEFCELLRSAGGGVGRHRPDK